MIFQKVKCFVFCLFEHIKSRLNIFTQKLDISVSVEKMLIFKKSMQVLVSGLEKKKKKKKQYLRQRHKKMSKICLKFLYVYDWDLYTSHGTIIFIGMKFLQLS